MFVLGPVGSAFAVMKTYADQCPVEFEQSKMLAKSTLLVEFLQGESKSFLNLLIIVSAVVHWTVRTDDVYFLCRNC